MLKNRLKTTSASTITESGKFAAAADTEGVKFLRMENNTAVYEVESGSCRFKSLLPKTRK